MLKIMKDRWNENSEKLRATLLERTDLNSCDYETLVKLTFETIFNSSAEGYGNTLNLNNIHAIDDGHYRGTILFVIPFDIYQPDASEYILTYIGYGSCSYCDALQSIQGWDDCKITEQQLPGFMAICKDLICNAVKPYNYGWREDTEYVQVGEE